MAKKKKEKITYIDDGRTLADMSGVSGPRMTGNRLSSGNRYKEAWKTYWMAVRMMFLPMLATIGAICIIFGILYVIFSLL